LQGAIADGSVTIENWSIWTLTARLIAGALGVSAFPVRSLGGSDLGSEHLGNAYVQSDLLGHDPDAGVVRAFNPDVVLLHAIAADPAGNVVLAGPYGEGMWGAMASRLGVIACVEEIVEGETIRHHNTQPVLPAHLVRAVCRVPRGSHPYALYAGGFPGVDGYQEDAAFIRDAQEAARTPESFAAWMNHWVTGVDGHAGYLELLAARPPARNGASASQAALTRARSPSAASPPPSAEERMVLEAARIVHEKVRANEHTSIIAGIGLAHLAAWVAGETLRSANVVVQLLAEIGVSGLQPLPGDPYLFASQNLPFCASLTGVMEVLGSTVAGPSSSCIGVLGAGQIDRHGNLNSTWSDDGRFLVGSGGANDIASAADEVVVVVKHAPGRLVSKVRYITAPGRHVTALVTTKAVFERLDDELVLAGYFGNAHKAVDQIIREIQAYTGWPLVVSDSLRQVAQHNSKELALLRGFDPQSVFLRTPKPPDAGQPEV
jgi:acyl CoA:acetate/3-ketoacid CoA transferase beta subunit